MEYQNEKIASYLETALSNLKRSGITQFRFCLVRDLVAESVRNGTIENQPSDGTIRQGLNKLVAMGLIEARQTEPSTIGDIVNGKVELKPPKHRIIDYLIVSKLKA